MTASFSLPANCMIRPACAGDRVALQELLTDFRQEVIPPMSQSESILRVIAASLSGGVGIHLILSLGWQRFINLLLPPAIVVGLGILSVTFITWNNDWKDFWVIQHHNRLVACAKLRCYEHYSLLHDVYVTPEWRSRGLGSHLVKYLAKQATKPLYLTCFPKLTQFYLRLGFTPVSTRMLSPLIQFDLGIPGRFEVIPLVLR